MTPRALLTAIGATAIGFAVVTGGAASTGMMGPDPAPATMRTMPADDANEVQRFRGPAPARAAAGALPAVAVSPAAPCPVAM